MDKKSTYTLTTINVQGDDQEAFEVYADETKEQTKGFVFDEKDARLFAAAPDLLAAIRYALEFPTEVNPTIRKRLKAAIAKAEAGQ